MEIKAGDLELRSCDDSLSNDGKHSTLELVKWVNRFNEPDFCFVICYWIKSSEGYDLKFVGNRFLLYPDRETFWNLLEIGQKYLDFQFKEES